MLGRTFLLACLLFVHIGHGWEPRVIRFEEERLKEIHVLMAEVRRELARVKEEQAGKHTPERVDILLKRRHELEAADRALVTQLNETKATVEELRSRLSTRGPCPICGGKLTKIGSVPAANKHARMNTEVWDDPDDTRVLVCGNDTSYPLVGPICTRCWAAPDFQTREWVRSTRDRDAFVIPLNAAIYHLPRPLGEPRALKFRQVFAPNGERRDSVTYLGERVSPTHLEVITRYAKSRGLTFSRWGKSWTVSVTTRHDRELPSSTLPNTARAEGPLGIGAP